MNAISINQKSIKVLGRETLVKLIKMGEDEGLTTKQAAELLGCTDQAIRTEVMRHGLGFVTVCDESRKALRAAGIIPITGRTPNFLPRETIRQLVRILNTDEAKEVYNQLWEDVEAKASLGLVSVMLPKSVADIITPTFFRTVADVVEDKDNTIAAQKVTINEQQITIAEQEDLIINRPIEAALDNAAPISQYMKEFPVLMKKGTEIFKASIRKGKNQLGPSGHMTMYMREKFHIKSLLRPVKGSPFKVHVYNRADILNVVEHLENEKNETKNIS